MMYILLSHPTLQYLSVYCDQRKIRSFSGDLAVQDAIKCVEAGHGMKHETLQDAINYLNYLIDDSNRHQFKVYSSSDYPELFI